MNKFHSMSSHLEAVTSSPLHSPDILEEGTSLLLYHGPCGRCHHLHTAIPISLPGPATHQRVKCLKCNYSLFGFGSNSTQTTLASVPLTSSSWEDEIHSNDDTAVACTNSRGSERSPLRARDEQAPNLAPPAPIALQTYIDARNTGSIPGHSANERQRGSLFNRPRSWLSPRPALRRVSRVAGESSWKPQWKIASLFHSIRRKGRVRAPTLGQDPSEVGEADRHPKTRDVGVMTEDSLAQNHIPPVPDDPAGSHQDETPVAAQNAVLNSTDESRSSKRQRIYSRRREKTLKKRSLQHRKCHCSRSCFCTQRNTTEVRASPIASNAPQAAVDDHSGRFQDGESEAEPSTRPPTPHPDHTERISQITQFLGEHFPEITYRVSSGRESSIHLEYPRSRRQSTSTSTGMSQATTVMDSHSSGNRRGLPFLRRRSNRSLALLPDVRFSEQERPDVMPAIRRVDALGLSARRSTDQTDSSNLSSSSQQQPIMQSAPGESAAANAPRATTASLARLTTTAGDGAVRLGRVFEPERPTPITEEPTPINQVTTNTMLRSQSRNGLANQQETRSRTEPREQPVDLEEVTRRLEEEPR